MVPGSWHVRVHEGTFGARVIRFIAGGGVTSLLGGGGRAGSRFLFVAACLVVVVHGLKLASPVLLPFSLALFLAILSAPLMLGLQRRGVPRVIAVLISVLAIVGVLSVVIFLATESLSQFQAAVPKYRKQLEGLLRDGVDWLVLHGVPVAADLPLSLIDPGAVIDFAQGTVARVATMLSSTFLVLLIMVFMLAEASSFPDKLRFLLGEGADLGRFGKIVREVQQYLGIKTGISLITGLLAGLWTALLGIDFPILWGIVAFAFNYIPTIGSIIAAIPPIILGLFGGLGEAFLVMVGYVAINVTFGNIIDPMLQGRQFGISTLVVILSLVFWGWVWGPLGMLLSVPLTMVLKIALENTDDLRWIAVLLAKWPAEKARIEAEVATPPAGPI